MTQTSSSPQVFCRPALESDYTDIAEFCKGIWDGGDYVPDVWHDWFKDENGLLATAEYDGHAIGCTKLTRLAEGQWWLEGFRVDPKYQGLKIGSTIHNYITDWWLDHCGGTIRLMTSAKNVHVHHLCQRTGYVKTYEVCGYESSPLNEPIESIFPVIDTGEAETFALASETLALTDHCVDFGWRICTLTEQVIKDYSNEGANYVHTFYWWRGKLGLFSAWEDEEEDRRRLGIGVLACTMEDMPALLTDIRRFAAREKFDEVFQVAFDLPQIVHQLEAAGFTKRWEHNAFIFEKQHPLNEQ